MAYNNSVPISMGRLSGVAYWDRTRQTYAALLRLFGDDASYPPSWARFGVRTGEFITPDALVNHLETIGLEADDDSLMALQVLSRQVARAEGGPELVGLVGADRRRHLFVLTPSKRLLAVNPRLGHDDYRLSWGDTSPATVETGRLICEQALIRRPAHDVESFALTLTYELLSEVEGDFSLDVNALCDWFLTDSELATALTGADLDQIRLRAGLAPAEPLPPLAVGW